MSADLCTRGDVFRLGVPSGNLQAISRPVASVNTTTNVLELDGHGFETGDQVVLRAAEGGAMASPLVEGTTYYVRRTDGSRFQLSALAFGTAIDLTSTGSTMFVAVEPPFCDLIAAYSRWIEDCLPAHALPLPDPPPALLRLICAELVGKKAMQLCGHTSESVDEAEKTAMAKLERWATGLPHRAAVASGAAPSNLAIHSSLSVSGGDPRGWGSGSLP